MTRAVTMAAVAVVALEAIVTMTTGARTHLLPGGFTLFGMLGALALVRVANALGAIGLQAPAPDDDDE